MCKEPVYGLQEGFFRQIVPRVSGRDDRRDQVLARPRPRDIIGRVEIPFEHMAGGSLKPQRRSVNSRRTGSESIRKAMTSVTRRLSQDR